MTTQQIADRLVALCRKADYETAQKELYAQNALSVEPVASADFSKETKGLDQILEKGRKFSAMVEAMHLNEVSDPIVAGNSFACIMHMDLTMKGKGRMDMKELCLYDVNDGKVVREEFRM